MELIDFTVEKDENVRLDYYLAQRIDRVSRTYIQNLIKKGLVLVNQKAEKPRYLIKKGDHISISLPKPKEIEVLPEDIPIDIVYQDDDIAIINKKQDMVVHPAPGNYEGTLVNALLFNLDSLSSVNDPIRPGIVHRLDKDTSGLLIVAKNNHAHNFLVNELKERKIIRQYLALVHGVIKKDKGIIDLPIGRDPKNRKRMAVVYENSKNALTKFKVLKRFANYSLVEAQLETGRTHQLRVHFAHIGHPIVADPVYSRRKNRFNLKGQLLHAKKLCFIHPSTGEYLEFETEMPNRFKKILKKIK
ncbi:MAG TPA: RluA family pseudouridine synthase [Tissierellaceae bacterium]|nr:RluA family pseudouridine synthase [Tissierellaceae bacterium]